MSHVDASIVLSQCPLTMNKEELLSRHGSSRLTNTGHIGRLEYIV